jgi:hypothetical protein
MRVAIPMYNVQPEDIKFSFDNAAMDSNAYRRVHAGKRRRLDVGASESTTLVSKPKSAKSSSKKSIFSRLKTSVDEIRGVRIPLTDMELYDDL